MLVVVVFVAALAAGPVGVEVDAGTNVVVGWRGEIEGKIFGLTAFAGFPGVIADADLRGRLMALRPGAIRFPASLAWFSPDGPERVEEWFEGQELRRVLCETLLFGARYPLGRFLLECRRLGIEPMVLLTLRGPKWLEVDEAGIPKDFEQWCRLAVGLFGALRRVDERLRLVQITNEPNSRWWRSAKRFGGPDGYVKAYLRFFNMAAGRIKARFPDAQVLGPVLCWPPAWPPRQEGQRAWYTWAQWSEPFLRRTVGTCDFFDFHCYDVRPDQLAAQLELLAAASEAIRGKRMLSWITESSYGLKREFASEAERWRERAIPYMRLLFGMLEQADKLAGNMIHDLGAGKWGILKRGQEPAPEYWVLWMFRDLRGWRAQAQSGDDRVKVAAAVEDDAVNIVCFNDQARAVRVDMKVRVPAPYWTGPEVRALVPDGRGCWRPGRIDVAHERGRGEARLGFELPGYGAVALVLRATHFLRPGRVVKVREAFARRWMVDLSKGRAKVPVEVPEGAASRARLRLCFLGGAEGCKVEVNVGGRRFECATEPWVQEVEVGRIEGGRIEVGLKAKGEVPASLRLAALSVVWREEAGGQGR